jgi:chlorobactene glucosyltransferase
MMFLAYTAVVFLAIRLLIALVNLFSKPFLSRGTITEPVLVSVLIPARNEGQRIPLLLKDLIQSSYRNIEILVYDDDSSDDTARMVEVFCSQDDRIRLFKGVPLPAGWLGKNHACHRLSLEAKGDYLLFLDADVRMKPGLIVDALSYLNENRLNLLSLFPVQTMGSMSEKITVPLINWVLLSLLPLRLISRSRHPSLAAANGQFMLFDAQIYRRQRFHEHLRTERVEDINIIRMMKNMGYRCQTLLSNGQVSCRMYENYTQAIDGFSKNVNAYFGNNWMLLLLFALLSTFGVFFTFLAMPFWVTAAYLVGVVSLRAIISFMSKQPVLMNILLMPVQQFSFWLIIFRGGYKYFTRSMVWKDRPISMV